MSIASASLTPITGIAVSGSTACGLRIQWATAGSALLALAGIAWTSLPIVLLAGCA
jgi:hypothetical protein